ncbi:MAG TPA: thioredoxin-like domain-containing protein [Pyrinomonadaceae bacterium]|nr:thioredoxin-like domain-containing protein [Pyrinomonadaceae bacterium]
MTILLACLFLSLTAAGGARGGAGVTVRQEGRVRAPELEGGRGWLNTDKALSLARLRGKVVLLDFWTYGCINCMHVIPDLQRLEEEYRDQLVVIGVHSAKFENERETENIRRIILRYGIEHPVVNDADFRIWNAYAVRAWPTQVLIDPAGYVVGKVAGEGHYEALDAAIGELVNEFRKRGALDERPLKLALERAKVGDLPLAFPGKVLADERGDRLFIADSNHNRVVVTRLDGKLLYTIGTGERGRADGAFDRAGFHRPQGLALDDETLFVADTANHLIRRVDLKARKVETIAGTGEQLRNYRVSGGPALSTRLSSPWDLLLAGRTLYVAMAGPHQIWALDLNRREISVFAGSGREERTDGARAESAFAQPSGLASDGRSLYVADSESNIIRAIKLSDGGAGAEVQTLAGGDLFDFGDRDGCGDDVRLQHPLGVAFHAGSLLIADTYNHKIKQLDPATRQVKTFVGTGKSGQTDGAEGSFYEPGGLSVAPERGLLYVADTNNHAVRVVDLKSKAVSTLVIRGLQPPAREAEAAAAGSDAGPDSEEIKLRPQRLGAGDGAALVFDVALPTGHHLNPSAPHRYKVTVEPGAGRLALGEGVAPVRSAKDLRLPLRLPLRAVSQGAATLRAQLTLYYCREDNTGTCRIKTLVWLAPVEVTAELGAPREVKLQGKVE